MATGARPYRGNAARQEVAKPASRANNALIVIAGGLFTIALALMLLMLASAQPGVVFGPDQATRLLAFEMIAVSLLLALTSAGARIRLTLQMILTYLAVYLILPGYHHSSKNIYPFYSLSYEHDIRLTAATIISVFLAALIVGYLVGDQTGIRKQAQKTLQREIIFPSLPLLMMFTAASMTAMVIYVAKVGLGSAFATRATFGSVGSILEFGVFVTAPRLVTFVAFAYAYVLFMRSRKAGLGLYYMLANLVPFFVTNFPLVLARYVLFGIVLFILVQTFDFKSARSRVVLTVAFVFGALFAMPYAESLTRSIGKQTADQISEAYDAYLASPDFDGLQSIQNAVIYTDRAGYMDGMQLLSVALFFVPREIWTEKSVATGELTSRASNYPFHNISQPLPSEFYVDFGMTGMAIVTLIFGFLIARLDGWINAYWDAGPRARLIAGIVVAYTIILMRGALLAIISSVVFFSAGIFLIMFVGLVKAERLRVRRRPRVEGMSEPSPRVARHARAVAENPIES